MANDEQKILIEILRKSESIFKNSIEEELNSLPLKENFKKVFPDIYKATESTMKKIENISFQELANVGLTGNQLDLKAKGFDKAFAHWEQHCGKKNLLRLLKWLNTILGSLSSIIPICEPIKEYKECLENHISENS